MTHDEIEKIIDAELQRAKVRIMAALFEAPQSPEEQLTELSGDLDVLMARLDVALAHGADRYHIGTEVHGKCRRAKKWLDMLNEQGASAVGLADVRKKLQTITERLLREVFELDDVQVSPLTEDQIQEAIGDMFDKLEAHLADQPEQGDESEEKE